MSRNSAELVASLVFPITGRPAKIVGRTPRSAAGPLAGLPVVDETDPVGEERVRGGNLLLWHLLERWLSPRGTRADRGADRGSAPQFLRNSQNWKNEWR